MLRSTSWILSAAAAALLAPPSPSFAQPAGPQPGLVVSVASVESLLANVDYLANVAGAADVGNMVKGMAQMFTAGLDPKRPAGAYATLGPQGEPTVIAFLPVSNLDMLLTIHKEQLGEPQDAGGGVRQLSIQGNPVFFKEQNGWAFFSNSPDNVAQPPADPAALLQGLDQQYGLAVRLNVQNIPEPLRQMAVEQMKQGMEMALAQQAAAARPGTEAQRQLAENLSHNMLQTITTWIKEADQLTVGWAVDRQAKTTYVDFTVTAVEGSSLADRMASLREATSDFAGFVVPEAAVSLHNATPLAQEEIEQLTLTLKSLRQNAMAELDKDPGLTDPDDLALAKEVVGVLFDVATATVKEGSLDFAASLLLAPQSLTFTAGGRVADGQALDQALRKLIDAAKDEPDFPEVRLDADAAGDVRFHTMSVPVPDADAQRVFGPQLDVVLGFGPKSLYLAFGADCLNVTKQAIARSAKASAQQIPASQLSVALAPILQFAAAVEENPVTAALAQAAQQATGDDKILIVSRGAERGASTRLEIQEGVLRVLGQAIKLAFAQRAPQP